MKNTEFAHQDHVIDHHVQAQEVISVGKIVAKSHAPSQNQLRQVNSSIPLIIQPRERLLTQILVLIEVELNEKDDYEGTDDVGNRDGQVFVAAGSYSFDKGCTGGEVDVERAEIYEEGPYSKYAQLNFAYF
jgi:hypothetical protein